MTSPREKRDAAMVALLCGELGDAERRELEEMMASDLEASQHFAELSQTFKAVQQLPVPTAPEGLADRLLDRLIPEEAEVTEVPVAAEIRMVSGKAQRAAKRGAPWHPAQAGDSLHEGEAFELGKGGRALLRLPDTSELWVNAETVLHFGRRAAQAFISIVRGEVLALVAKQTQALPIVTPAGTVRVLGTTFNTDVERDGLTRVSVIEGQVEVTNKKGREKVSGRQRIEVKRGQRPSPVKRMRPAEIDRLTTWTSPIRSASKSAHRVPTRENRKDSGNMESWWKYLIGIIVIGLIGFAVVKYTSDDSPQIDLTEAEVTETFTPAPGSPPPADATADSAGGESAPIPEGAVVLNLDHTLGLSWVNTIAMDGRIQVLIPQAENQDIRQNMTMVMNSEITEVTPEGNARFDIEFADFQIGMTVNGEEMDLDQMMAERGEVNFFDALRGMKMTHIYDRLGNLVESESTMPSGGSVMEQLAGGASQDFMTDLMESVGSGVPDGPVRPGAEWTRSVSLPEFNGPLASCASRFDRIETVGDEQIAFIQRIITLTSTEPLPSTVMEMNGAEISQTYQTLRLRFDIEQQFNITTGRWAGDEGTMLMDALMNTRVQPPQGPPENIDLTIQATYQMQSDYTYES